MAQFTLETVDAAGGQHGLALDRRGNPFIAYVARDGTLMLATRASGAWTHEAISGARPIERSPRDRVCLEFDSENNPHVVYPESESRHLTYGVRRGRWEFVPVPTRLLRLDPGGVAEYAFRLYTRSSPPELRDTPHFVFYDSSTGQLGYTRRVGGQLKLLNAAAADGVTSTSGLFPSIGFDDLSASFLITYIEILGRREDSQGPNPPMTKVWLKTILEPFDGTLSEPTLLEQGHFNIVTPTSTAINGRFCVACADSRSGSLNAWVREQGIATPVKHKVATTHEPVIPSAAHTANGAFRIAYADDNKLKLASQDRFGHWNVEAVDDDGGAMPCLAYDRSSAKGHLAYSANGSLKYATWTEQ